MFGEEARHVPLRLDAKTAPMDDITALKKFLATRGYTTKIILDDAAMERISNIVTSGSRYRLTPPEELRYLEGLLNLPLYFMTEFGFIPANGYELCECGRTPTALDVVQTALKEGIHSKALVRNTILGRENVFELADAGRQAECISCARQFIVEIYHHKRNYMYA
jgi:hypothetical protein